MEKNIVANQLCITMVLYNLKNIKDGKENTANYIGEIDKVNSMKRGIFPVIKLVDLNLRKKLKWVAQE